MKKKKKVVLVLIAGVTVLAIGILAYVLMSGGPANDLGLTRADLAIGGLPDVEALRAKTKAVADTYLAQHHADLTEACGAPYELTVDYSLSPKVRSLGYRSSFYYYCWDIYLPYSLKTNSGHDYIVLVQLSDGLKGHEHDPDKFRVLRAMVIDNKDQVKRQIER